MRARHPQLPPGRCARTPPRQALAMPSDGRRWPAAAAAMSARNAAAATCLAQRLARHCFCRVCMPQRLQDAQVRRHQLALRLHAPAHDLGCGAFALRGAQLTAADVPCPGVGGSVAAAARRRHDDGVRRHEGGGHVTQPQRVAQPGVAASPGDARDSGRRRQRDKPGRSVGGTTTMFHMVAHSRLYRATCASCAD